MSPGIGGSTPRTSEDHQQNNSTEEGHHDAQPVFSSIRLQILREAARYTSSMLATRAACSPAEIEAWEAGQGAPDAATVAVLAAALDCETADLWRHDDDDTMEYWGAVVATMPPLTEDQIHTIGVIFRRIDRYAG